MEEDNIYNMEMNQKSKFKKYLLFIGIGLILIILTISLIAIFTGGPEKTVKNFIKAYNNRDIDGMLKEIDFAGTFVYYDAEDFEEPGAYEEFLKEYSEVDKDDIEDEFEYYADEFKDSIENMEEELEEAEIKLYEIKDTKKIAKDLYVVSARILGIAVWKDGEEELEAISTDFVIYKNKIIYNYDLL